MHRTAALASRRDTGTDDDDVSPGNTHAIDALS